jgi:hypothetical protein
METKLKLHTQGQRRIFTIAHAHAQVLRLLQTTNSLGTSHNISGLVCIGYAVERGQVSYRLFTPSRSGVSVRNSDGRDQGLLDDSICGAVQVFNGITRYGDEQRLRTIQGMLAHRLAKRAAVGLVSMRGKTNALMYSQLEDIVGQEMNAVARELAGGSAHG